MTREGRGDRRVGVWTNLAILERELGQVVYRRVKSGDADEAAELDAHRDRLVARLDAEHARLAP